MTLDPPTERERALACHAHFCERVLPVMLRRIGGWTGAHPAVRAEFAADVRQELAVDCLEHPAEVLALPERERHRRWLRLAERFLYRVWLRTERRRERGEDLDAQPAVRGLGAAWPDGADAVAEDLAEGAQHLRNGRLCMRGTAAKLGVPARQVRLAWTRLAHELGLDAEYSEFWRRRLVEALVGLAADRLRDEELVWVDGDERRPPPDPDGRARRLRRIRRMIARVPVDQPLRSILARCTARRAQWRLPAADLLAAAAALAPRDPAVLLWQFEAAVADGDARSAARALRAARRAGAGGDSVTLARARLLESRQRVGAATALLRRRLSRSGPAPKIARALQLLEAARPPRRHTASERAPRQPRGLRRARP